MSESDAQQHPWSPRPPPSWTACLLGGVSGAAWQVTQPGLWAAWTYGLAAALGLLGTAVLWWRRRRARAMGMAAFWAAACAALLMAGTTGWRAQHFAGQALAPQLEGVDLQIEGIVATMVQRMDHGQRWLMAVDHARTLGEPQRLRPFPPLIELSWYGARGWRGSVVGAVPPVLQPGQRWRMVVRLKRPHGARNPHGFDYELWQWERGVQATGYVRERPAAELLQATPSHFLQRWRQRMRDAIGERQATLTQWPGLDAAQARRMLGVVAALAVGDQQAIELVLDNQALRWLPSQVKSDLASFDKWTYFGHRGGDQLSVNQVLLWVGAIATFGFADSESFDPTQCPPWGLGH